MCLKTENRGKLQASFFGSTRKKYLTAACYMSHCVFVKSNNLSHITETS